MRLSKGTKTLFIIVSVLFGIYAITLVFPFLYTLNKIFFNCSEKGGYRKWTVKKDGI